MGHDGQMRSFTHAEHYSSLEHTPQGVVLLQRKPSRHIQHASMALAIETLPYLERLVLNLIYFEDLSFSETAAVMQQPENHLQCLHDQAMVSLALTSFAQPAAT